MHCQLLSDTLSDSLFADQPVGRLAIGETRGGFRDGAHVVTLVTNYVRRDGEIPQRDGEIPQTTTPQVRNWYENSMHSHS